MDSFKARDYIRTHVLGLVAIFVALTGTAIAAGDRPTASSSVVSKAKFKKLKQRVGALEAKVNSPISGDLSGTLPNLTIKPGVVSSTTIADNAITQAKLANDAVTQAKLANDAVGSSELKDLVERGSPATTINPGAGVSVQSLPCPSGRQLISGGGNYPSSDDPDLAISGTRPGAPGTWMATAVNNDAASHVFAAFALCLPE